MAQNFRRYTNNNVGTSAATSFTANSYDTVVGISVANIIDGGAKFVMQSGDALKIVSDTASSLDVWVSVVDDISS